MNRRAFLTQSGVGLGSIALASLLRADEPIRPVIDPAHPNAPRPAHLAPRARNVLMIYCSGALSQLETFDYKPELVRRDGQPLPESMAEARVTFQGDNGNLAAPLFPFQPRGACGKMTSDLLPHLGALVDDFCFLHSLTSRTNTHGPAENFMSTGFTLDGFPSIGSWVSYALGTSSQDLPAFVAIPDPRGVPQAGVNNWGPGFLPAFTQGTAFSTTRPLLNLARPASVSPEADAASRRLVDRLNREHLARAPGDTELAARIAGYELAARMQLAVPEIADLSSEPAHILKAYGADDGSNPLKAKFARNCILARRLIERGVRFVEIFNGAYAMGEGVGNWDGHRKLREQYLIHGPILDQPAAALIADLKQRGRFEDTLIAFVTEFGRMPMFQKGATGRDHNPHGFTAFLSGAGVKAPFSYGATDELGYRAVERPTPVHDLHATILHLLGLDHERLSFYHNGLERRLTDVHGNVIKEVVRSA